MKEGLKYDKGKLQYRLIPPIVTEALATVLTFGANKYGEDNWQNLDNAEKRYTDALYRHLEAWRSGEVSDEESGEPHLWHAITNLAFLIWLEHQHYTKIEDDINQPGIENACDRDACTAAQDLIKATHLDSDVFEEARRDILKFCSPMDREKFLRQLSTDPISRRFEDKGVLDE